MLKLRKPRGQRGASMAELALVLFILLLLVAAVADFGRVFNSYVVITNASREGARYAADNPGDAPGIKDAAQRETQGSSVELQDDDIAIDPDPVITTAADPGEAITVTVGYTVPTIIADIAGFGYLPLRARTQMRVLSASGG